MTIVAAIQKYTLSLNKLLLQVVQQAIGTDQESFSSEQSIAEDVAIKNALSKYELFDMVIWVSHLAGA